MVWPARARANSGAAAQNVVDQLGLLLILPAPLLDGLQFGDDRVRGPALALDAADACGTAAGVDLLQSLRGGKNLVQIAHRAYIGIARIAAPHARRIGHHGLEFLPHHGRRDR